MTDGTGERTAVDPQALESLRRFGGDALLEKLVLLFRDQVAVRTTAMHAAVASGDMSVARQAAHALRSSAGQVGAVGLQQLCVEIEHAAMHDDAEQVTGLVKEVDNVIPAVDQWLTDRGFPKQS